MSNCENCKNYQPKVDVAKAQKAWEERNYLRAEGNKLRAEGNKLYAEGNKLRAEGDKLCAEGNLIFINVVIEVYGNVEIKWNGDCAVVEGVEYK